jgi:hypothetical protein
MVFVIYELSDSLAGTLLIGCLGFEQVQPIRMTMKNKKVTESPAGMAARLLSAFLLLLVAFGANAADCNALYAATGAVPGSPTCGGMRNQGRI